MLFVPRKNSKTTLGAGICLFSLFCGGEQGNEIYSCAADRDQAAILYNTAADMVRSDPELEKHCEIRDSQKVIRFRPTKSIYKVLSSEAGTKHGLNPNVVLMDELHAWPDRELYDVMISGQGARKQPLNIIMTTAGYDKDTICYEVYDYACKVRDGLIDDPTFLPLIYEAPKDCDPFSEAVWKDANPNYGLSVQPDFLQAEARRAQELPTYLNTFKRLYLNIWTDANESFISSEAWKNDSTIDLKELYGLPCYCGLDLASTADTASFVMLFPFNDKFVIVPRIYVPSNTALKRERRDKVPYSTWHRNGFIQYTPGDVTDYDYIRKDINDLSRLYNIREIAVDRWNATQLSTQLQGDGFEMVGFGQGYQSLSAPTKELEKLIISKRIIHNSHPVLAWMASNVVIERDSTDNIKPSKAKSTEKIDAIVATIMALGRYMVSPGESEATAESVLAFL